VRNVFDTRGDMGGIETHSSLLRGRKGEGGNVCRSPEWIECNEDDADVGGTGRPSETFCQTERSHRRGKGSGSDSINQAELRSDHGDR